jgi:hypothetical protein
MAAAAKRSKTTKVKIDVTITFEGFLSPADKQAIKVTPGHIYDGGVQVAHIRAAIKMHLQTQQEKDSEFLGGKDNALLEYCFVDKDGKRIYQQSPTCHHVFPLRDCEAGLHCVIVTMDSFWLAWESKLPGRVRPGLFNEWPVYANADPIVSFFDDSERVEYDRIAKLCGPHYKQLPTNMICEVMFIDGALQKTSIRKVSSKDLAPLLIKTPGELFPRENRTFKRQPQADSEPIAWDSLPGVEIGSTLILTQNLFFVFV